MSSQTNIKWIELSQTRVEWIIKGFCEYKVSENEEQEKEKGDCSIECFISFHASLL